MRKIFLIVVLFLSCGLYLTAQVTATGAFKSYQGTYQGIDYLFVFNGINNNTSLQYTGSGTSVNWYRFSDQSTAITNQSVNYNVENATGYILDVDGKKTTIWVIDYQQYLPVFSSLTPQNKPKEQCEDMYMDLKANIPVITYHSAAGATFTIDRKFKLSYNSKEWASKAWKDLAITNTVKLPDTEIYVNPAPLCDTRFKVTGDQFAEDLGISPLPSVESSFYSAVAVEAHIVTTTSTRSELQEDQYPSTQSAVSGSAPLDIFFESNANVPVALYYKWDIYKNKELLYTRSDKDQRYTFSEPGTYKVKVTASSDYCQHSDSVDITVAESAMQVPKAFTPNGDGKNDEFRVAYRSLKTFKCWVFNRWGRKIYYWDDPQKGWNGTHNGRKLRAGAYIYIIEAKGTDNVDHSTKGVINMLTDSK